MVAKALILEVRDNMVKERERFRRLTEKVVDIRDDVITQKAEIKALRSRHREDTPAMGITAGLNTVITKKKKKNLNYLKRLNDDKNHFYKFWQRVIHYKIIINKYKILIAVK